MSKYSTQATTFAEGPLLVEALKEHGYSVVEVHETPQTLIDYHGNPRPQKANIIVRRAYIDSVANDVGFVWNPTTNVYDAIISEYDASARWKESNVRKLSTLYAEKRMMRNATSRGLKFVNKTTVNGKVKLNFVQVGR